jgi:hypothetical protein
LKNDKGIALRSNIDYRIIILILSLAIAYYFSYLNFGSPSPDEFDIFELLLMLSYMAVAAGSILVSRKYDWHTEIFAKTYFFLGIGYALLSIGDILYYYIEVIQQIDPFPSIAFFFYACVYPFQIYHLIGNIRYFRPCISSFTKIWIILVPLVITLLFIIISSNKLSLSYEIYYTIFLIAGASISASLSILGLQIFYRSILGTVWILLAAGLFLNSSADIWFDYTELYGLYVSSHPVNTMFILSDMLIFYALFRHYRSI